MVLKIKKQIMSMTKNRKTVYVAMSGGVDSSVAAALLKKQGHNVTGVFMRPWQPEGVRCLWQKDKEDAMRVAAKLGIPFLTWDFSKEYKKEVADYMIKEYRAGRTPNPDVMCNKHIKFGLFLERSLKEGADLIATGHYARIERKILNPKSEILNKFKIQNSKKIENLDIENSLKIVNCKLKIAKDKNKDQSYFLWTLTQEQLKYCLFPVGDYKKPEVRKIAKKFGLSTAEKKDSQGVCFIGPLNMKEFLKKHIKPKRGKILDMKGGLVGFHDGVYYYTIGQRHGLDIKNGKGPYFVVTKDVRRNIVYVGGENKLGLKEARVADLHWISGAKKLPAEILVRTRYRAPLKKAVLRKNGDLRFKNSERAVTSGQSAVFYEGNEMLGGGIIL